MTEVKICINSPPPPKKSLLISNMKVFAAFMVVFVHSYKIFSYTSYNGTRPSLITLMNVFAKTGVPLFFIFSGYLQFRKDFSYKENIRKKCKTLLIPFFIWNTLYYLFDCMGEVLAPSFFDVNFQQGFFSWLRDYFGIPFRTATTFYGPIWFVRDLFILCLLAPVVKAIVKKIPTAILSVLLVFLWISPLPYCFRQAFCFYFFGAMIALKSLHFPNVRISACIVIATILLFVVCCLLSSESLVDTLSRMLTLFTTFSMTVLFIHHQNARVMHKMSSLIDFSFPIYLWHGKILSFMQALSAKVLPQTQISITIEYFAYPILTIIICVLLAKISRKLFPKIYVFSMGNR